jgi:hypothetical protein
LPPPSSHTTGRAVPHPAVHEVVWKRCRVSSSETRPTLANQDLGNACSCAKRLLPPRAAPVACRGPRPFLRQSPFHQVSGACRRSLPLPPEARPQFVPKPAVHVLQYSLLLGQAKVIGPSSQEGIELLDRFGQALAASFAEHLPHLGFEAFAAGFGVQWTVGQSSDPLAKPAARVTAPITTKS